MEILACRGVRKIYGAGAGQVTALDGISLTVKQGEFVAVVGASGSGKSTLLHILGGVDKPTEGTVTVDGTELSHLTPTQAAIDLQQFRGYLIIIKIIPNNNRILSSLNGRSIAPSDEPNLTNDNIYLFMLRLFFTHTV